VVLLAVLAAPPAAQERPAGPAGVPRTASGQPNLQGVWNPVASGASHSLEEGSEPAQDLVVSDGPRASTLAAQRGELSV
jgi:hypothetical protein